MKKNYLLLSGLILSFTVGFSQSLTKKGLPEAGEKLSVGETPIKVNPPMQKAFGDTMYYQDFNSGIPAGWSVTNQGVTGKQWIWDTAAPGGQYSTNAAALNSPTGANGFMSLPMDFYNTPFPTNGPDNMDTWFTSPQITFNSTSPSVLIKFWHSQRYCCLGTNELVLEVSTNGTTWTAFDATGNRPPNTQTPNAEQLEINVSSVLGSATTGYIRFRATGSSHYYWMIDDITVEEGPDNAMVLEEMKVQFTDSFATNPFYTQIPQMVTGPMTFEAITMNPGANTQTGVDLNSLVVRDSAYMMLQTTAPTGVVDAATNAISGGTVPSQQRDTTVSSPPYVNQYSGHFSVYQNITTDSVNQRANRASDFYRFIVTDTIFAMDRGAGNYFGDAGPGNYQRGGNDGDQWGQLYNLSGDTNYRTGNPKHLATSISYFVANAAENDGVSISPRIFDEDTFGIVASSPFSTLIDTSMFNTWITIPLFPAVALDKGAQYYVGWEQISGANNSKHFSVARDRVMEAMQPDVTTVVFFNDASPVLSWVTQMGAVRLNLGNLEIIGLEEEDAREANYGFEVYPNPNNGQFIVRMSSDKAVNYDLSVRNMVGQNVFTRNLNVYGNQIENLDLSNLDKGVYFVTLENSNDRKVRKVIVR